ncbi:MAG TPA: imidazoleglycerol-phosphate dehydratase HisB [Firmicutes bacterium]|nr:imidazoleglycerol-phosphate dehydratase HisB [Bacillota bacterium]
MRSAMVERKTGETDITVRLELDGRGVYQNNTGVGFLNHMLDLFAKHGHFDLQVSCTGDTDVDFHHTVEDTGICLGQAFAKALGEMRGINRYGNFLLPMDETLVLAAVDLSGREFLNFDITIPAQKVGDFDTELVKEFFYGFVRSLHVSLHLKLMAGENSHHIIEAVFKAAARALKEAVALDPDIAGEIPSTKGRLL